MWIKKFLTEPSSKTMSERVTRRESSKRHSKRRGRGRLLQNLLLLLFPRAIGGAPASLDWAVTQHTTNYKG